MKIKWLLVLSQNWYLLGVKEFKPRPQNRTLIPLRGSAKLPMSTSVFFKWTPPPPPPRRSESVYERHNTFYYIDTTVLQGDTPTAEFSESEVKR